RVWSRMSFLTKRVLSIPAQLSSAHGVRAGRDDLVCGARSNCCEPGQKGGIRHVFGPFRAATIPYKLSDMALVGIVWTMRGLLRRGMRVIEHIHHSTKRVLWQVGNH